MRKQELLQVRLTYPEKLALEQKAKALDISMSELVREIINDFIEKSEKNI